MALAEPPVPPFHDTMKMHIMSSSAFHQDDLWAACGGGGGGHGATDSHGILCSDDELSSMVSMVTSLQECHRQHRSDEFDAAASGMQRNVSFESGGTGSHDSTGTPPSFSTESPVTVLPPLAAHFSRDDDGSGRGHRESSKPLYDHFFSDGLWTATGAPDQDESDHILGSPRPGDENISSLLLRSFVDAGVDHGCSSDEYRRDQLGGMGSVPSLHDTVSSHCLSYPLTSSDNKSGSTPSDSSNTGTIESGFRQEFLVGLEFGCDINRSTCAPPTDVVETGLPTDSPKSTPPPAASEPRQNCEKAQVPAEHGAAAPNAAAHRRLSWTDQYWPATAAAPAVSNCGGPISPSPLSNVNGSNADNTSMRRFSQQQPHQQFIHGLNATSPVTFQDADYIATCTQYRKGGLQRQSETGTRIGGVNCKRSFSTAMEQSGCTNVGSMSGLSSQHSPLQKHNATEGSFRPQQQQDAAALSALLYKNNGNNGQEDLIQQLHAASTGSSGGTTTSAGVGSQVDGGAALIPPPRLRRRHGTATDPQSVAARTRREKFSDRIRLLQSLVPNGERLDTVSMLGHTLEYVRFLQHQVWQLYNGCDDPSTPPTDPEAREKWKEFMDHTQNLC